jgi:HEAT repeat protein
MRVWTLGTVVLGGSLLAGCGARPTPPATEATPDATAPESSASHAAPSASDPQEPPAVVSPDKTAPANPTPSATANAPAQNQPLRDIAAKLVAPTEGGGWRIDEAAALELERLGANAPASLLPLLDDNSVEVRRGAAYHLLSMFDPNSDEQTAGFVKTLGDKDATIRGIGFQAIRQLPKSEIANLTTPLINLLVPTIETKAENRANVARFVGSLGPDASKFIDALQGASYIDPDERVRAAALFALTQVAPPEQTLPWLKQALADKHPAVRLVAAGRLRVLGTKAEAATPELIVALGDSDERVRTAAAEALAKMGPSALPQLQTALGSQDANVRKLSLACLASLGRAAKPALAAIEKCQQDADKDVAEAAKILVERLK